VSYIQLHTSIQNPSSKLQKFYLSINSVNFSNFNLCNSFRKVFYQFHFPILGLPMQSEGLTIPKSNFAIMPITISYSNKNTPLKNTPFFLFQDWEDFPDPQIKFIHDRFEFNLKLKNHFLNQLSDVPVCNRLFCPVCHL
jgi:hypothetical protein